MLCFCCRRLCSWAARVMASDGLTLANCTSAISQT